MEEEGSVSLTRRRFLVYTGTSFALGAAGGALGHQAWIGWLHGPGADGKARTIEQVARNVIPPEGFHFAISFTDSLLRLIDAGTIDPQKFRQLYEQRGGLPTWVEQLLSKPSSEPIRFSPDTAPFLLNLFWPLGLATKTRSNEKSPLNGPDLPRFASTAGWVLGREKNGGTYFNRIKTMPLDDVQEERAFAVAMSAYRPCCNNSTFVQDCNHGSALLGLLELAASQGQSREELYRLALIANSYWYPTQYVEIALFFAESQQQPWGNVRPEVALSSRFSSLSGWQRNVHARLRKANLLPAPSQQNSCRV